MLRVDIQKWQQSQEDLRVQALQAEHPRTRERFLALYEVTQGTSATQVGKETQRNPQTVMAWIHLYNDSGPTALHYRHTGGHPPLYPNQPSKKSTDNFSSLWK